MTRVTRFSRHSISWAGAFIITIANLLVCAPLPADAADKADAKDAQTWNQFRGPRGDGDAGSVKLPVVFSDTENVVWKTAIEGAGHSSPVISGNSVWVTAAVAAKLTPDEEKQRLSKVRNPRNLQLAGRLSLRAICVDLQTGDMKHNVALFEVSEPEPKHQLNSYASPTPFVSGGRVFCHFGTYGTAALDATTGEVIWRADDLHCDHQNGPGSSAIVWKDLLIAQYDGIDQQFVAARHVADGSVAWKQKRTSPLPDQREFQKAYCTPQVIEHNGQALLISPGSDWVYAYNPADGKQVWRANYGQLGFSTVPRPIVGHGMVYICTSYMKSRLLAIRYDGTDDVSDSHVAWKSDSNVPQKPSLLLLGENLYMVSDRGVATCLNAKTGRQIWRDRLPGKYSASPLHANGHLYFFSEAGVVTVLKAADKFEVVATNTFKTGFMASPAVHENSMLVRTETHLYRIAAVSESE